jgi:hypothetical protein
MLLVSEVPDQIAYYLYLLDIVIRNFYASLVFNRWHQFNAVEIVGPKIVYEMRFTRHQLNINAEMFGSTPRCLATRMRTSLMERHSSKGAGCWSGVNLPMVMMNPPIRYVDATSCKSMRPELWLWFENLGVLHLAHTIFSTASPPHTLTP